MCGKNRLEILRNTNHTIRILFQREFPMIFSNYFDDEHEYVLIYFSLVETI